MSWLKMRRGQKVKRIQVICFVSKVAYNLAANIYGWANPEANLLCNALIPPLADAAQSIVSNLSSNDSLEQQYFTAVEDALVQVEQVYRNAHGKHKLINDLISDGIEVNAFTLNLKGAIEKAETYREQYMTSVDAQEIVQCFESALRKEVAKYPELSSYFIHTDTRDALDTLKRLHVIAVADDKMVNDIYRCVTDTNNTLSMVLNDTTQIKADLIDVGNNVNHAHELIRMVQSTLTFASEILLHSMVVFFAFTAATVFYQVPIENDLTVCAVVLLSELLIRFLIMRMTSLRTLWTVIPTQALFITACTMLVTANSGPVVLICALIGVIIKHALLYFQTKQRLLS